MYTAYIFQRFQRLNSMINSQRKLILVILGSFLAQIVQVGVFPLYLAQSLDKLNIPLATIGWYLGAQWLVVLLLAPIVPKLSAKLGLDNTNKLSGLVTIMGLLFIQVDSQSFALLATLCIGCGLILRWIACDTLVIKLSDKNRVGRSIGIHETLMGLGIAIGPLLFTWLELEGVFYAALILLSIATFNFFVIGNSQYAKHTQRIMGLKSPDLKVIHIALLLALAGGFIETSSVSLFPFYFRVDGFSLQSSAWFVSAFGFGGTLLQLPLGFLVDKLGYQSAQFIACLTALLALVSLFIAPSEFITLYVILFFFGGAVGAFNTLAVIQAGSKISTHKSASAMAYIAIFYTLGSVVGPVVTASILDGFATGLVLGVYGVIVVIMSIIIMIQHKKID